MPISQIGLMRLQNVQRVANEDVDAALQGEAQKRARNELLARRARIAQTMKGLTSLPANADKDLLYTRSVQALGGLSSEGEEGYKAASLIPHIIDSYAKLHPAPKAPAKRTLTWIDATETKDPTKYPLSKKIGGSNQVQKLMRGVYVDEEGNEVPTDMHKYESAGSVDKPTEGEIKRNDIKEQPIQFEIPQQVTDEKGNVSIVTKNFQGKLGEASRSLQTEKRRIEEWFKKYTKGGGATDKNWYGGGGEGKVGFNLDAALAGEDDKNAEFYKQNPDAAETIKNQAAAYKRIRDLETQVNKQGGGVGNFGEKQSDAITPEETKVLDNVTYVKHNGKWFKQK